mgnify:CR=1 FL=1
MGSIARSLQRADYLKPTVDSLYGYLQRRRYEQGLQQLAEMLSGSENRIEDIYTGTREEKTVTPTGRTTYPALGQLVGQDPVQRPETLLSSLANTQPKPLMRLNPVTKNYEEEKVVGVPETITETKQIPRYTPQEQNKLAGQEINSFLRRLITSQDIPMERGQVGLSALQQLANTYKPEIEELMSVSPGASIIGKKTGKEYYKNPKTENKLFDRELSKKNDATGTWWDFDKQTGQYVDTGIKYDKNEGRIGGTTVNVGTKSYGDKLGEVVQTKQEIDNIKKAKWVPKDEVLRAGYTWNGGELGGAYIYGDKLFYTDQELNNYKEQVKTKAVGTTVALLNEQGLDNAKQKIDADVSKGASYKEAYDAFVKNNPNADKEDLRILYDYIDLMGK